MSDPGDENDYEERRNGGAGLRLRPGDQQLPEVNDQPFIQDLLIADIEKRRQLGVERYGTPLQPYNGRDALQDAYDEALDLATYLKQCIVERDGVRVTTDQVVGSTVVLP